MRKHREIDVSIFFPIRQHVHKTVVADQRFGLVTELLQLPFEGM